MENNQEEKMSRSKTFRRSFRDAFGIKKNKEKVRTIDSRLGEYIQGWEEAASKISDEKIAEVRAQFDPADSSLFKDADIAVALASDYSRGNAYDAHDLLEIFERSEAGILLPYSPDVKLLGAVNRGGTTCWLDSLFFAMFARADDFEAMLFHSFEDASIKRLEVLVRFWINLVRSGKLVTVDITQQIQESLSDCGWKEAAGKQQQDASEGFTRITDFLELPRLTLKKDMFHQGKADSDDHKFTHERTIDIGIPPPREEGQAIKLEDCLENYFDETVNVNRQKEESARRNTVGNDHWKSEYGDVKNKALHIEVAEVGTSSPTSLTPTSPLPPYVPGRPQLVDTGRMPSIFSEREVHTTDKPASPTRQNSLPNPNRKRSATIGKQVSMRAFQFFRLIPWYTEGNPNTDLQVAQHFETKRPAVGICLKRFVATDDSGTKWTKRTDFIDIPIESGIPGFLHDDDLGDEVFPNWKFKLSLQAVICHRGATLERGHYVSLVRVDRPKENAAPMPGQENISSDGDPWVLFDDLAKPLRVRYVNIEQALKEECPYLLIYKIVLIDGEGNPGRVSIDGRPPSYSSAEDTSQVTSKASPISSSRPSHGNISLSTAPSLTRAKSDNSSVISNTPGPAIQVQMTDLDDQMRVGRNNEGQQVTVASGEFKPEDTQASGATTTDRTDTSAGLPSMPRSRLSSERLPAARSRPSSSSNPGSVHRLSQIFKTQPTAKGSKEALGRDAASADDANARGDSIGNAAPSEESRPPSRRGFRKSMDEMRSVRRKEKEKEKSHRRERSLGSRLKAKRNERPDRECSVM